MSLDPATTVTTTATTATSSRPISPFPNPNTKPLHHYASHSQQQQQTLPVRSPNPLIYRFGSPSRAAANHAVGGGYLPPPQQPQPPLLYSHGGVRGMNLDYLSHALHVTRPLSHVQFPHLAAAATSSPTVKGHPKVSIFNFEFEVFYFVELFDENWNLMMIMNFPFCYEVNLI
jgi:hypothetical protein